MRKECCKLAGFDFGPENRINIVPDFALRSGPGGYRPHLALVYLFQESSAGVLGFAACNPVPPADLRHKAGVELEEDEPVYILELALNKLSIVVELTGVASLGVLLCAAIFPGKILEV